MAKVHERTRGLTGRATSLVFRHLYNMHFVRASADYEALQASAMYGWSTNQETRTFGLYFYKEWVRGRFGRWQCFHTLPGFVTTNNPAEALNNSFKRLNASPAPESRSLREETRWVCSPPFRYGSSVSEPSGPSSFTAKCCRRVESHRG